MNNINIHSLLCLSICCEEPKALENILLNGLGWEIYSDSFISKDLENIFNIKKNSVGNNCKIYRSPKADRGMIRVIKGRERIRKNPRSYRWGGFEVVVMNDIDELFKKLLKFKEFIPISPPANYDFTSFESNIHRAFSAKLPGGTHATFTKKLTEPKNRLFPKSGSQVGHIFEVPLNTSNYKETKKFYEEKFGLIKILESITNNGPLHNSWKIPVGEEYSLGIFKSSGIDSGFGSIEVHGCKKIYLDIDNGIKNELDGGASIVTFLVNNIKGLHNKLIGNKIEVSPIINIEHPPYNGKLAFSTHGLNSEKIEFVENWNT